jgi:hypothetical protein
MASTPSYRRAISKEVMALLRELPKEQILAFLEQNYMLKRRGPKPRAIKRLLMLNDTNRQLWKNYV